MIIKNYSLEDYGNILKTSLRHYLDTAEKLIEVEKNKRTSKNNAKQINLLQLKTDHLLVLKNENKKKKPETTLRNYCEKRSKLHYYY